MQQWDAPRFSVLWHRADISVEGPGNPWLPRQNVNKPDNKMSLDPRHKNRFKFTSFILARQGSEPLMAGMKR